MLIGVVKKVVHVLSIIIYVLIGIYVVICIPIIFGYKPLVVLTGSMEPTLKEGGIVYYKKVPISELKVGDIITFKLSDGTFVSHRINEIQEDSFKTKGDANNTVDPNDVPFSMVEGKDTNFCIPFIGFFVKFVNNHLWIVAPIIIILLSEFLLSDKDFDINKEKGENYNYGRREETKEE